MQGNDFISDGNKEEESDDAGNDTNDENACTSEEEQEKDTDVIDTSLEDENEERFEIKPKKNTLIKFKLFDENKWRTGKVKDVGKKNGKQRFDCWIEENEGTKVYNFDKDVDTWGYRKLKISFGENTIKHFETEEPSACKIKEVHFVSGEEKVRSEEWKKREVELEKDGVANLRSTEKIPVKVLAVEIPKKEYDRPEIQEAMREEIKKWNKFGAFELVQDDGQDKIDCRWVVNKKEEHDGQKVDFKARLCVRGFKELEDPRSDSPTAAKETNKMVTAIAANEGWEIISIDVTSAFLQGADIPRDVFVEPPLEAKTEGMIWKLNKAGYGLLDASRLWFLDVRETLTKLGCKNVSGDEAFFYYRKNEKLCGCVIVHVDDFNGAGNADFINDVMNKIFAKYECSKREVNKFRFTGIDVDSQVDGIKMSQNHYVDSIEEIQIEDASDNKRGLSKKEFKLFRKATGKLSWLAETTRPDLSYNTLEMSYKNRTAKVEDVKEINKIIRKAKSGKSEILFKRIGDYKDLKILGITDGSYLKMEDKMRSVAGRFIFLSNLEETRVCPLLWKSKTIPTVCKSAKAAETRAADKALDDSIFCARTLCEIYTGCRGENQIPVTLLTDSQSLLDSVNSTRQVEEKLIRPLVQFMKDAKASEWIKEMRWVATDLCVADMLTKAGSKVADMTMDVINTGKMFNLKKGDEKTGGRS